MQQRGRTHPRRPRGQHHQGLQSNVFFSKTLADFALPLALDIDFCIKINQFSRLGLLFVVFVITDARYPGKRRASAQQQYPYEQRALRNGFRLLVKQQSCISFISAPFSRRRSSRKLHRLPVFYERPVTPAAKAEQTR